MSNTLDFFEKWGNTLVKSIIYDCILLTIVFHSITINKYKLNTKWHFYGFIGIVLTYFSIKFIHFIKML